MREALLAIFLILFCFRPSFGEDAVQDGVHKKEYANGVWDETTYKNGKKEGLYRSYWQNGKPQVEIDFRDNKANGIAKYYYRSGNISQERSLKDGKIDGVWKSYDENGKILMQDFYKDGALLDHHGRPVNGAHNQYFERGLRQENNYVDGQMDGIGRMFDNKGKLLVERKFVKGKIVAFRAVDPSMKGPHEWTAIEPDKIRQNMLLGGK